jgi:hypothetical protein
MSLHAWQTRLWDMVIAQSAGAPVSSDRASRLDSQLSDTERDWLVRMGATPGFRLMCDIQRGWREFRVQAAAPLTFSLLGPNRRMEVIAEFIRRNPTSTLFFMSDALPFLDVATEWAPDVPHLVELAAFERARLLLGESLDGSDSLGGAGDLDPRRTLEVHPQAAVLRFRAPVDRLIAAVTHGLPSPPVEDHDYWLLVAPRLRNLARISDCTEAHLFEVLRETPASTEAFRNDPAAAATLTRLWQAGALRAVA